MRIKKFSSFMLVAVFLIPMAVATGIFTTPASAQSGSNFIYGTEAGPVTIDPATAWDSASDEVLLQICEGLYQYNMSDPNSNIIPWLASAMPTITDGGLRYNIPLRTNITFSDGYAFNATAVVDNFNRLIHVINAGKCSFSNLYQPFAPKNNDTVIAQTIADTNGSVTFVLNYPYIPFQALLCFSGSLIISPSITNVTYYQNNLLTIEAANTHPLIGTGPFMLTNIKPDESVTFTNNPTYWGGPNKIYAPHISTLTFKIIQDQDTRNLALLKGEIDMIDAPAVNYIEQFKGSSKISLVPGPLSSSIEYIGMNVSQIPQAVRQAVNYAFDYNYALTNIYDGTASRLTSPIPVGIQYHLNMTNIPTYNITKARQILINANLTAGRSDSAALANVSDNVAWLNASNTNPLFSYSITYNLNDSIRVQLGKLLQTDLAQIGIKLTIPTIFWSNYTLYSGSTPDTLQFYSLGWMADYNDPQDYVNQLLIPGSNDLSQINDTNINGNATLGMESSNPSVRQQCYDNIQKEVALNLMPWIMVAQYNTYGAWLNGVTGVKLNLMGFIYFGPVVYTPTIPGYNTGLTLLSVLAGIGVIAAVIKKRTYIDIKNL